MYPLTLTKPFFKEDPLVQKALALLERFLPTVPRNNLLINHLILLREIDKDRFIFILENLLPLIDSKPRRDCLAEIIRQGKGMVMLATPRKISIDKIIFPLDSAISILEVAYCHSKTDNALRALLQLLRIIDLPTFNADTLSSLKSYLYDRLSYRPMNYPKNFQEVSSVALDIIIKLTDFPIITDILDKAVELNKVDKATAEIIREMRKPSIIRDELGNTTISPDAEQKIQLGEKLYFKCSQMVIKAHCDTTNSFKSLDGFTQILLKFLAYSDKDDILSFLLETPSQVFLETALAIANNDTYYDYLSIDQTCTMKENLICWAPVRRLIGEYMLFKAPASLKEAYIAYLAEIKHPVTEADDDASFTACAIFEERTDKELPYEEARTISIDSKCSYSSGPEV